MRIRPFDEADRDALYRVCLHTGDSGGDATQLYMDPRLLGHVYVGPYLSLQPDLALVLSDDDGPVGYTLGAADTRSFERRCEQSWWPALRAAYPLPPPAAWQGNARDLELIEAIHRPSLSADDIVGHYPAHLHIDLEPRAQHHEFGTQLITTLLTMLKDRGIGGVHLGVGSANRSAIGFYRHLGFVTQRTGPHELIMARPT